MQPDRERGDQGKTNTPSHPNFVRRLVVLDSGFLGIDQQQAAAHAASSYMYRKLVFADHARGIRIFHATVNC